MHRYETLFVLHPELPDAQIRETADRVRRLIEGMQGQVADLQDWGMRDLAYVIEKQTRGIYLLVQYAADPAVVKELERNLKIADEVLRFISVRMPEASKVGPRGRQATAGTPDEQPEEAGLSEQGN
jgi:small subunit ribosomal protein S6